MKIYPYFKTDAWGSHFFVRAHFTTPEGTSQRVCVGSVQKVGKQWVGSLWGSVMEDQPVPELAPGVQTVTGRTKLEVAVKLWDYYLARRA